MEMMTEGRQTCYTVVELRWYKAVMMTEAGVRG